MGTNRKEYNQNYLIKNRPHIMQKLTDWQKNNPNRVKENSRRHYLNHKESISLRRKNERKMSKLMVLEHYSKNGKPHCECCGESHFEFLTIDHINGGGDKHKKEINAWGSQFYRWLIKSNYPPGFQILCMNCNFAEGKYGGCPHKLSRLS